MKIDGSNTRLSVLLQKKVLFVCTCNTQLLTENQRSTKNDLDYQFQQKQKEQQKYSQKMLQK